MRLTRAALLAERARRRALRRAAGMEPVTEAAVLQVIREARARVKAGLDRGGVTIAELQRDFERDTLAWRAAKDALAPPRHRRRR
jgi:hypothetical protein